MIKQSSFFANKKVFLWHLDRKNALKRGTCEKQQRFAIDGKKRETL